MKERLSLENCIFFNRLKIDSDLNPCQGDITTHEVLYRSEGGKRENGNTVFLCQAHQRFVHSKNTWGNENFDLIIPKKND